MTSRIKSIININGFDGLEVGVECHISNGLPAVIIIGYASKSVDEAKDRLRAAFSSAQLNFPRKRITLNLSPADVPKDSASLDMAMAVAILAGAKQIKNNRLSDSIFLGELSLDGEIRPVSGLIGRLMTAKKLGYMRAYVPIDSLDQALLVPDIDVIAINNLRSLYLDLSDSVKIAPATRANRSITNPPEHSGADLSDIAGQQLAKRALLIATAGRHNILLHGPPGTGKTMLARAACAILPSLEHDEILESTHIHSLVGNSPTEIITTRPFRAPHHSSSSVALVGGGTKPKPGEASLAHCGVLFLDELPEFSRVALNALRQPLEDREVTIARARGHAVYPANFILIATQNPCPCGYWGTNKTCICSGADLARYQRKVSGPIIDRIDLHVAVHGVEHQSLLKGSGNKNETKDAKALIDKASKLQQERFGGSGYNADMTNRQVRQLANLSAPAKDLLDQAASKLDLSARAYIRCIKVARTIADLGASQQIEPQHIAETLQYRQVVNY